MSNESDSGVELDGARAWCHVIYGLHALAVIVGVTGAATVAGAFVFGVPSLLAVVLNYLKRGEVRRTWLALRRSAACLVVLRIRAPGLLTFLCQVRWRVATVPLAMNATGSAGLMTSPSGTSRTSSRSNE